MTKQINYAPNTEAVQKSVLTSISNMMMFQEDSNGNLLPWFFCFGTLLEFVVDRTFGLNFDIDVGILYDSCNSSKIVSAMEGFGYSFDSCVLHDVDRRPLNIHFKPVAEAIKGTPELDIYFWIRKGNMLYHTYDVNRERSEILSKYVFKGIKADWVCPDADIVKAMLRSTWGRERIFTETGIWQYDIFGDHSGFKFPCPFKYGTMLDEWYKGWLERKYHKGQSMSTWTKTVKSCRDL